MVSDGCAVGVGDGPPAFLVNEVADERGVEDERLRAHFVAGHAFGEGGDFGGGEGDIPDADFGDEAVEKKTCANIPAYLQICRSIVEGCGHTACSFSVQRPV